VSLIFGSNYPQFFVMERKNENKKELKKAGGKRAGGGKVSVSQGEGFFNLKQPKLEAKSAQW